MQTHVLNNELAHTLVTPHRINIAPAESQAIGGEGASVMLSGTTAHSQLPESKNLPHVTATYDVEAAQTRPSVSKEHISDPKPRSRWPLFAKRFRWPSTYTLLAVITAIISLAIYLPLAITKQISAEATLTAVAIQLFAAILIRNEEFTNTTFGLVGRISAQSLPYWARKIIAEFHHYGGVHVGCAISAVAWYIHFGVLRTIEFNRTMRANRMTWLHLADFLSCWIFMVLIILICLASASRFRARLHNWFECIHRFFGWTAITVLWINTITRSQLEPNTPVYRSPALWFLAASTFLIILPWTRIRTVPIQCTAVSGHEIRLRFPFAYMPYCATMRFSHKPLMEWHAFATIPADDGFTAEILITGLGDWTKQIVSNPPERLWIRNSPAANFLKWTSLFHSVLLVGTGSGIGPLLSLMASPIVRRMKEAGKKVRVMWVSRDPDAEHWDFVRKAIDVADDNPIIFDTRIGKPDIALEACLVAQKEKLEVIMVVSNKKVTDSVVKSAKNIGITALGAVFDS